MVNQLHGITVGIAAIETARTIAMGFRLSNYRYVVNFQERAPFIDLPDCVNNKTDVIEPL